MKLYYYILLVFSVILLFLSGCSMGNNEELSSNIFPDLTLDNEEATITTAPDAQLLENEDALSNPIINGNASVSDRCFYGENSGTSQTFTGLDPLQLIDFDSYVLSDTKDFSTELISHSYGVASNEKPHLISINNQKFFDEKGFDAVCYDNKTEKKALYLTFDCGYENGYTEKILDVLKKKNVTAAFFCTLPQVKSSSDIIARMINEGHIVGNHSVNHPDFSALSSTEIIDEIKGLDDYLRENFGYSSLYFRYPQGKYSEVSTQIVNDLGYKCVFWSLAYADWDIENQKGAQFAYETVMSRLHPGAVILLHAVSPDNAGALADIIDSAREKGYDFLSLEELQK